MDAPQQTSIRLEICPQCGYSLRGLPSTWRCPECGFDYDDQAFVLQGVSRGSGMKPLRVILWLLVGLGAAFGPSCLPIIFLSGKGLLILLGLAAAWAGVLIFLLVWGKQDRRAAEQFIFLAGGFGRSVDWSPSAAHTTPLTSWRSVDTVTLSPIGPQYYRLRIAASQPSSGSAPTALDIGIRCDSHAAAWIQATLQQRLAAAHGRADNAVPLAAPLSPDVNLP